MAKRRAYAKRGAATKSAQKDIAERMAEKAPAITPEPAAAEPCARPYAVMLDGVGRAYLQVALAADGTRSLAAFTARGVEVVRMDAATAASRGLEEVDADVLEAARVLREPLSEGIAVSPGAAKALDKILNDEEWIEMAKKEKAAGKAGKAKRDGARKAGAPANAGKRNVVLSVKRAPKDGELPAQAAAIVGVLKGLGKATVDELLDGMAKAGLKAERAGTDARGGLRAALNLYRAKLARAGILAVEAAAR